MKFHVKHLFPFLITILAATNLYAAVSIPFGWYVEANGGQSRAQGKSYPGAVSPNGFGWNADMGYKFSPYVGAEVGYSTYADTRVKAPDGTYVASDRHFSYIAASKVMFPIADTGLEVFGKLGLARSASKLRVTDAGTVAANNMTFKNGSFISTGTYMALGTDYAAAPNINLNLQWARAKGNSNTGDLDLYTVGITLLFG